MSAEAIKELVEQLGEDQEVAYKARLALQRTVTRASATGNERERAEVASQLAGELTARTEARKDEQGRDIPPRLVHGAGARQRICRLLAYVGGAKEVPALTAAMGDLSVREAARFGLEKNPSDEATDALIAALDQVGPVFLTGVVSALAKRKGPKVLAALQKMAGDEDADVRLAAVAALAEIPDPANDELIYNAANIGCPTKSRSAHAARVRLAETLLHAGNRTAAERIYRDIESSPAPDAQKTAARMALKA